MANISITTADGEPDSAPDSVSVPADETLQLEISPEADGGLTVQFETVTTDDTATDTEEPPLSAQVETRNVRSSAERIASTTRSDGERGEMRCLEDGCETTFETFEKLRNHCSIAHGGISLEAKMEYGPAHQNPRKLQAAWEACETLEEMREYLETDISVVTLKDYLRTYNIGAETTVDCVHPDCDRELSSWQGIRVHFWRSHGTTLPDWVDQSTDREAIHEWIEETDVIDDDAEDEEEDDDDAEDEDQDVDEDDASDGFEAALEDPSVVVVGQIVRACDLDRETVIERLKDRGLLEEYTGRLSRRSNQLPEQASRKRRSALNR